MINKIDNKTRIKLKFHIPALRYVLCLQRKKWYGWVTTSWIYPSLVVDNSYSSIKSFLFWKENRNRGEFKLGKEIMSKNVSTP